MKKFPFNLDLLAIHFEQKVHPNRPVIFLHGNSQNNTCGRGVIEFFKNKGHPVLYYDLPGHGESEFETEDYQFDDLIDLNFEILRKYEIVDPILVGHSLGGMIHSGTIARYAKNESRLKNVSLVLLGSLAANPTLVAKEYLPKVRAKEISDALTAYMDEGFRLFKRQRLYDYFENRGIEDGIANILNRRYSDPKASFVNLDTLADFDVRAELKELAIPIVMLHGKQEQVIHAALVEGMAKDNNNIRLEWYPNNGHLAFYQQSELTSRFLNEHYSYLN